MLPTKSTSNSYAESETHTRLGEDVLSFIRRNA